MLGKMVKNSFNAWSSNFLAIGRVRPRLGWVQFMKFARASGRGMAGIRPGASV